MRAATGRPPILVGEEEAPSTAMDRGRKSGSRDGRSMRAEWSDIAGSVGCGRRTAAAGGADLRADRPTNERAGGRAKLRRARTERARAALYHGARPGGSASATVPPRVSGVVRRHPGASPRTNAKAGGATSAATLGARSARSGRVDGRRGSGTTMGEAVAGDFRDAVLGSTPRLRFRPALFEPHLRMREWGLGRAARPARPAGKA